MTAAWVLRRTVGELRRQRGSLFALAMAFAVVALLAGGYRLAGTVGLPGDAVAGTAGSPPVSPAQVIAYLRDDLNSQAISALREVLLKLPGVGQVRVVTPEEALTHLRARLGDKGRLLDGAEDGLLPTSLEVWLKSGGDPAERGRQLAWRLARLDGVVDVDVVQPSADDRLIAWARGFRHARLVWLAVTAVAALALLIFGMTAGRARKRAELRVLLSLGFTRTGLFLPTLLLGIVVAVAGSACGLGLAQVGAHLATWAWAIPMGALPSSDWALALGAGALLGAIGALLGGMSADLVDAH